MDNNDKLEFREDSKPFEAGSVITDNSKRKWVVLGYTSSKLCALLCADGEVTEWHYTYSAPKDVWVMIP